MNYSIVMRQLGRNKNKLFNLDNKTSYNIYCSIMKNEMPELILGAFIMAMRIKGECPEEIIGFYNAAQEQVMTLQMSSTSIRMPPIIIPSYNGSRQHANLTPLLAIALTHLGFSVIIHGIRSYPGRITSIEILEKLKHNTIILDSRQNELEIKEKQLLFIPIEILSPPIAKLLQLRITLGIRNSAHFLTKLITPLPHNKHLRLINISHQKYIPTIQHLFNDINHSVLLFKGTEGEPYIDPINLANIYHIYGSKLEILLDATSYFLPTKEKQLLNSNTITKTTSWIQNCLDNKCCLPRNIALQLACCLVATKQACNLIDALIKISKIFKVHIY